MKLNSGNKASNRPKANIFKDLIAGDFFSKPSIVLANMQSKVGVILGVVT